MEGRLDNAELEARVRALETAGMVDELLVRTLIRRLTKSGFDLSGLMRELHAISSAFRERGLREEAARLDQMILNVSRDDL